MNYEEFVRHVGKAGLRLNEFAGLVGMTPKSLSNYRKVDKVPGHLAMIAALLGEMAERGIDYREILSRIDISPKKSRETDTGKLGGGKVGSLDN